MGCLSLSAPIANEIRVPVESWEDNTEIEVTSRGGWLQNRVSWGEARCLKLISGPAGTSRVFCFPFLELSLNPEGPAWGREITSGKERNKESRQRKWSFYTHRGWPRAPGTGCPEPRQVARGRHTLQSPRLGPQSCAGWGWQGPGSRGTDGTRRSPPPPALGKQEGAHVLRREDRPTLASSGETLLGGLSAGTAPEGESLYGSGRGPLGEGTAVGCPWKWPQGLRDVARTEEARRTSLPCSGKPLLPPAQQAGSGKKDHGEDWGGRALGLQLP